MNSENDSAKLVSFFKARKHNIFAADTETTGLDPHNGDRPFSIAFCQDQKAIYVDFSDETYPLIQQLFADPQFTWIWHNAAFDVQMLLYCEIPVAGKIHDTMLIIHGLMNYRALQDLALKKLARELLFLDTATETHLHNWFKSQGIKKADRDYSIAPRELVGKYAMDDVRYTEQLFDTYFPQIVEDGKLLQNYRDDIALLSATIATENRGNLIDITYCKDRQLLLTYLSQQELAKFYQQAGRPVNPNSLKQINQLMQDKNIPPIKKTEKGNPSWGEKVIRKLAKQGHEFVVPLLKYKQYSKIANTFFKSLAQATLTDEGRLMFLPNFDDPYRGYRPKVGRIHGQYHPITKTYRTASSHPNMQNIPAPKRASLDHVEEAKTILNVRRAFISPPHFTLHYWDYSQLEYRMFAWLVWKYTGDTTLIDIYAKGYDFHAVVGAMIHGKNMDVEEITPHERFLGKHTNFACLYGVGIGTLSEMLTISTAAAKDLLNGYHERFDMIGEFEKMLFHELARNRYISNPFGRRYHIMPAERRLAINYITQGTAGDVFRRAWVKVHKLLKPHHSGIVNAVHDDLAGEIHQDENHLVPKIQSVMEDWPMFDGIHFKVSHNSVRYSWGEHDNVME